MTVRLAQASDIPALEVLIPLSARQLQVAHYSSEQIEGAIGTVFGVDSQLIADGTYYVAEKDGRIVGCGGWSRRKTTYGSDKAKKGPDPLRDPTREPAMIRAFFVHPEFARQGIATRFLTACEQAAYAAGFTTLDIVATLPGEPFYAAFGYAVTEKIEIPLPNGAAMPARRMTKRKLSAP